MFRLAIFLLVLTFAFCPRFVWGQRFIDLKTLSANRSINLISTINLADSGTTKSYFLNILSVGTYGSSTTARFHFRSYGQLGPDLLRNNLIGGLEKSTGVGKLDISGPSLDFPLFTNTRIVVGTKLTFIGNYWDVNGRLISEIAETSENSNTYPYTLPKTEESGFNFGAYSQIYLSVSQQVISNQFHQVILNATVKYINGISNSSLLTSHLAGDININSKDLSYLTNATGNINLRTSTDLFEDFRLQDLLSLRLGSAATDFGITWIYKDNIYGKTKLAISLSVNDIGQARFRSDSALTKQYAVKIPKAEGLYFNDNFKNASFGSSAKVFDRHPNYFTSSGATEKIYSVALPRRLEVDAFYLINSKFAVDANVQIGLNTGATVSKFHAANQLRITPNLKIREVVFGVPVVLSRYTGVSTGIFANYKGIFGGSDSIISAVLGKTRRFNLSLGYQIRWPRKNSI